MTPAEIIIAKRDGCELTDRQIRFFINGFACGQIPDYQMSALAMAIFYSGMTVAETHVLTAAMLESGSRLTPIPDGPPRVDKHSTGGLGDKVSLILAPLLACCDVHVPMISGRGLGCSGGTLDKLEAIPEFRVDLSNEASQRVLRDVGCFIIAASSNLVPADRKLYALRDVTGTVESIPLITASILSKKLAAGLDALVMDVKLGAAAFMKSIEDARQLADSITSTSIAMGMPCRALLTDMDQPLGAAVGNAIEVNEAVEVLRGQGPATVRELTVRLCAEALMSSRAFTDVVAANSTLNELLDNGRAYERFVRMVTAQGGVWNDNPLSVSTGMAVTAERSGYLSAIDGRAIGNAVITLGGGRRILQDEINPAVGLTVRKRIGASIDRGEEICRIHAGSNQAESVLFEVRQAFIISEDPVPSRDLILHAGSGK